MAEFQGAGTRFNVERWSFASNRLHKTFHSSKKYFDEAVDATQMLFDNLKLPDVELNEVALSLENIEVKHESGELALEPYKKQLSDLERRKEKAEGTVNSVLTRLRGESE